MEITLGCGSYCRVSSYQEGLESTTEYKDLGSYYSSTYWENIHQWDGLDY